MLSSFIAGSSNQSRICQCKSKPIITTIWIKEFRTQLYIKRRLTTSRIQHAKKPTFDTLGVKHTRLPNYPALRTLTTESKFPDGEPKDNDKNYKDMLSAAIDQSNVSIAQSLIDTTLNFLRKGNPEAAWECYLDLTSRNRQKHISREQYKHLIKYFNHYSPNHKRGLEYVLTLVEDMKQLGYQVGRKEKLLVMRLLGLNGNLTAMEKVSEDLSKEQLLEIIDPVAAQKPYNIMLTCYLDQSPNIGGRTAAEKAMQLYGEMLDRNVQPAEATTRLLLKNIRKAENSTEMVENVWNWVWTKIGMNVGGKTKELEPSLYRGMVMYFASVGRTEYALEINDIMKKKKIPRTVPTMTALIHKVGRAGDIARSMDLLNEMVVVEGLTPTVITFNTLIDIHAHKKPEPDVAGANRMYSTMIERGLRPDNITFSTLIDMYAKLGNIEGIQKVYKEMTEKHHFIPNPYVYSSLMECFIKLKDNDSALKVLSALKIQVGRSAPPAREAYNLMFRGLIQNNNIVEGIDLLGVMIKDTMKLEARTFTPLLTFFAQKGDTVGAHKVASMMAQAKIRASSRVYACLLQSYAKAGDIEGAENLFNIYKRKYRPDEYIYNGLLYVYTKMNEMDKVLDTYKRMTSAHVPANVYTYGILMNFYSKRKDITAVEALMGTMQSNHVTPSVTCWTILMQAYFECHKPDKGRKLVERMVQAGLEPSDVTWSILISGCIESNELEFAESVLQQTIEKAKRSFTPPMLLSDSYLEFKHGYEKGIPETIEDVMNKAHGSLETRFPVSPYLFTPIIQAHGKNGDFDQAKTLIKTMCDLNVPITVETYTAIMTVFKQEAKFDVVELLWNALYRPSSQQKFVENVDPVLPRLPLPDKSYSYTNLLTLDIDELESAVTVENQVTPFAVSIYMDTLLEQDRGDEIQTLWQNLTQEGYCFDEQNWNRYLTCLIYFGKLDEACTLAYREFLEPKSEDEAEDQGGIYKTVRKRDDISISNDDQLHTRTCVSFAVAFELAGAEHMAEPRLRSAVSAGIKDYIQQQKRLEIDYK